MDLLASKTSREDGGGRRALLDEQPVGARRLVRERLHLEHPVAVLLRAPGDALEGLALAQPDLEPRAFREALEGDRVFTQVSGQA